MAALRKRGAAKREVDLEAMVATGAPGAYEALQLYRSKAIRFRSKNDFQGALDALSQGAKVLLQNGYLNAGTELATLMIEMLDEENKDLTPDLRNVINEVDNSFPENCAQRIEFLKGCVKWTVKCGARELGDPMIHVRLASVMWAANDKNAVYHFAAGEAPEQFVAKLEETHSTPEQQVARDRSLTLCVLHFLALENLRDANELMDCFKRAQKAKGVEAQSELITFLGQLLETCRRDAQPLFKELCAAYSNELSFDETAGSLLTGPIGARLFGITPRVNPMMSMLQNMLN
jgi:hypothetical protein